MQLQTLTYNDYHLFQQLVAIKQNSLHKTMSSYLKKHYPNVITTKDFIFAKGEIPVALVAHLDTVFAETATDVYYDKEKNVIWSPQGLGADDRAGVFAIIKLIRRGYRPHIILTTDEELGALGAKNFIKSYPKDRIKELDIKYIIQLDRRGTNDCVFYDCENSDFVQYVESFGFIENWGSFSDISIICPAWEVAGVNLSVGYEDEHSLVETFHITPFLATVKKVAKMLEDIDNAPYFKYIPAKTYKYIGNVLNWDEELKCSKCGHFFNEYEMFPVKSLTGTTKFLCPECLILNAEWCETCNEAFELEVGSHEKLCKDCRGKVKCKV